MNHILDTAARLDPDRDAHLNANDEAERAWIEADRAYLQSQEARAARRLMETIALEQSYLSRMGWSI